MRFREHIALAKHVATPYARNIKGVLDREDIFQSAYEGLWRACLEFDESLGYAFSTYAHQTIRGYILRSIRDENQDMKIPRWFTSIKTALARHQFTLPLNEEQIDLLIEECKVTREQLLSYSHVSVVSIDSHVDDSDSSCTFRDFLEDKRLSGEIHLSVEELREAIEKILIYIPVSQRAIVRDWLYSVVAGEKITQIDLATKYSKTQSYISRVIRNSMTILQSHYPSILELLGFIA